MISSFPHDLPQIPKDRQIVLIGGVYDVIHYGHIEFLRAAKKLGNHMVLALESDAFVEKNKQRRPIHSQRQRAEILSHINLIDAIVLLPLMEGYADYVKLVEAIKPHVIAVTEGESHLMEKERQAAQVGAQVISVIDRYSEFSTTNLLNIK